MNRQQGFTIIEVILFLAISGALVSLMLIGVGTALQNQQYRDAVQSYAGFLRGQYSRVVNVENDRLSGGSCPISGVETSSVIGQSECVIIGRYIQSNDANGRKYAAYPVYGHEDKTTGVWSYGLGVPDTTIDVQWGVESRYLSQAHGNTSISILMFRHPEMGNLLIRTDEASYVSNIGSFVDPDPGYANSLAVEREICMYGNDWLSGQKRSVFLGARSGSSDSVTVANSTGACS